MTPLSMKLAEHVADCLKLISSGTDDVVEEAGGKKKKRVTQKLFARKKSMHRISWEQCWQHYKYANSQVSPFRHSV